MNRLFPLPGLTLLILSGCSSMQTKFQSELVKPLAAYKSSSQTNTAAPESERDLCIETARTIAGSGHFNEAIALYEQAETLDSQLAPLDKELAPLYAQIGLIDKAIDRYQKAIVKFPDDAALRNNLVWTLIEATRFDQAIKNLELALEKHPSDKRLLSSQAVLSYRLGLRDKSIQQFNDLYGPAVAYHNVALLDIESGELARAQNAIQKSLAYANTPQAIQLATAIENAGVSH